MKTLRTRMKTLPALPVPDRRQVAGAAIFLWVAVSPWLWGFADNHAAVANHVALVFGFAPLALIMVNLRPAAFVTLLGGVWLIASPWLLGYATDHSAWLNELVSGATLVVLRANAAGIGSLRRVRSRRAPSRAGEPASVAKTAGSGS
jgi:SPW repeat